MINLDSETKSETEINCSFTDIKLKNYFLNCRINEDMKGDFQTGISFIGDNVLITYLDTYNESIIEEKKVSRLALGLPKNMDGSLGFAAERSLSFKEKLEEKTDVPITLIDERLSTVEAEGYLINEGIKGKKKKDIIDAIAANIILDTFIRMKGREEDGKR